MFLQVPMSNRQSAVSPHYTARSTDAWRVWSFSEDAEAVSSSSSEGKARD